MNKDSHKEVIIQLLKKYSSDPVSFDDGLRDDMELIKDLGMRSSKIVDFVIEIEDMYDVEIHPDTMDEMVTLGETINAITDIINGNEDRK